MAANSLSQSVFDAAKSGEFDNIRVKLQEKKDAELKEIVNTITDDMTPLIAAVLHGHTEVVKYLVESCFADIELKGSAEITDPVELVKDAPPLWYAAEKGHLDIAHYLISMSANVDSPTFTQSTPLRAATFNGHYQIVVLLVKSKADLNAANRKGQTPLQLASALGRLCILKYLLENGARMTPDNQGWTPLHGASEYGHPEVVKILLAQTGIDVDAVGMHGETALHLAATGNHLNVVQALLIKGATQLPDKHRVTPLLKAASDGSFDIVKLLLTFGGIKHIDLPCHCASLYANVTPLQAAAASGHEETVLFMLNECRGRLSRECWVEALELLGSGCLCNDKRPAAMLYWKEALRIREKHPVTLGKSNSASIIYKCTGEREVETVAELTEIQHSDEKMDVQAALISDRIAGPASQQKRLVVHLTLKVIWDVALNIFKEGKSFSGAIRIFESTVSILLGFSSSSNDSFMKLNTAPTYHNFTRVLKQGLHKDKDRTPKQVKFEHMLRAQKTLLNELRKEKALLDDEESMQSYREENRDDAIMRQHHKVISLLQMISLTCEMLDDRATQSQEEEFRKLVKDAVDLKLKAGFDQTLLELASTEMTSSLQYGDEEETPIVEFPCIATMTLLESAGAE